MEAPRPKVTIGLITGAVVTILVFVIQLCFGVTVPAEVATAATSLLSFFASYLTPDPND